MSFVDRRNMSSRAVRKTAGHTTEDDLAQVLQKVGVSSHDEDDFVITSTSDRRRNVFEMLVDDDDEQDEGNATRDSDEQTQEPQPSTTAKTKRKRKAKKKNAPTPKAEEVND